MPNRLTLLAGVALLALAAPLTAQQADAPETVEAPEAAAPAAEGEAAPAAPAAPATASATTETTDSPQPTEAPADAGAPQAAEGARPGQPYVAETHGDWSLRCLTVAEGETEPCQLYQLLQDDDGNAVAEVTVLPLAGNAEAAAGLTITVPLETLLTQQLTLTIDGGEALRYPFAFCNQAGCVARVGLSEPQLASFRRGRGGELRIVPAAAPDQEVLLDMSLAGFTAGFEAVGTR